MNQNQQGPPDGGIAYDLSAGPLHPTAEHAAAILEEAGGKMVRILPPIAATSELIEAPPIPTPENTKPAVEELKNEPISWQQLGGAFLSDYLGPGVVIPTILAILGVYESAGHVTARLLIIAALGAYITALQVTLHITNSDGLARRLKAMGQMRK
jgi:hypothetical protein